jgi:hypothetical protein
VLLTRVTVVKIAAALTFVSAANCAELPAQPKKPKQPETAKHCDIAGSPGILSPGGICVRMSGYISAGFGGSQLR